MNNQTRIRWFVAVLLVVLQVGLVRFMPNIPVFPDFLFLIIAFNSLKSGFFKSYLIACLLGWLTDYLTGGIIGVFGFSRVISAALLHEMVRIVDLKRKGFTFFLILFSLFLSNLIGYFFYYLIEQAHFSLSLLFWQPITTAILAVVLVYWKRINAHGDVY